MNGPTFANVCDNCNNVPKGMLGKKAPLLNAASVARGSVPSSSFLAATAESVLKISSILGEEILCRFGKPEPGCSVQAFQAFRHALKSPEGF